MNNLRKLKVKERFFEQDFYVFDTETTPFKLGEKCKFIFGVIYGFDYKKVIFSKEEFIAELKTPRFLKKKVFAHNAEFDLNVLYDNIFELDNNAIFNGRFIGATNEVCYFADSMNIFPTSVKNIGKMIGLHKQELSKEFWDTSQVTKNDITYCVRDCEIIYEALLQIFNKVGNIKITLAGLSLDLFRRYYQRFNIEYESDKCNKFFHSYYGGRCEAFQIGECQGTVYDINSMYPYAMQEVKFPNPKFLKHKKNVEPKLFIEKYLTMYEGMCFCRVNHKATYFGFLPYRSNGKLLFPVGMFEGYYNFNELRFAVQNGAVEILEVKEMYYAPGIDSPFIEYVQECYRLRFHEGSTDFDSYLYKNFANTLYGKFAQKIETEQIYIPDMTLGHELIMDYKKKGKLKKICPFNEMRNDCFIEVVADSVKYMVNTIPLFSSYITSFARVLLLEKMLKYEKFKPLYCDTDSVFFAVDPNIPNSKLLGEFKKENKLITNINGLKNYEYICDEKERRKLKGVPEFSDREKTIPLQPIDNIYYYESLVKTKESLRRNIDAGTTIQRTKQIRSKYDKRIVYPSGETASIHMHIQ